MDIRELIFGWSLDPSKGYIDECYPSFATVQSYYNLLDAYGVAEHIKQARTFKELAGLYKDVAHLNIPESIYVYLRQPFFIEGVPASLIAECNNIFKKNGCVNDIVYGLSEKTQDKLHTFGYLKYGTCLMDVLTAFAGGSYKPNYSEGGLTIAASWYEVCVRPAKFVKVPVDVMFMHGTDNYYVQDGQLYLEEGVPYGPKK